MQSPLKIAAGAAVLSSTLAFAATAEDYDPKSLSTFGSKPNIILIVSDDTGYWDLGAYHGGAARGMPTPNLDQMAKEGMMFTDFYAQSSCTPGRAAMQTGRYPNRSGMTTVAFQGQGGGLPAAEWTLASVLKQVNYNTYFMGKWHLGESDYALPTAHGYDKMENTFLYHLNAYTYALDDWHPQMTDEQRAFFKKVTTGVFEGEAGSPAKEVLTIGEMTTADLSKLDDVGARKAVAELERLAGLEQPFFMSINWAANHQPNLPAPDFKGKAPIKNDYGDKVHEMDHHSGAILQKVKDLGIEDNTLIIYTVDNGAWQDVHPDAGMTPFRGTKGTDREGAYRVPLFVKWTGKIEPGTKSHDIVGGTDFMATFAHLAGIELPKEDREGQPMIFDSIDMAPVLFGETEPQRDSWAYFTENELAPGAVRVGPWKAVFNIRGDNGARAGSEAPAAELGWRGSEKYVATVPQVFNLWEDPMERYDIFMTTGRENTWTVPTLMGELERVVKTYIEYPPRPVQSESYSGPITLSQYHRFQEVRDQLKKQGFKLGLPTGN